MTPDRRHLFANDTIAHSTLRGQVDATQFSTGRLRRVIVPVADLRVDPKGEMLDRQVLFGHPVCLLDPKTGFCRDETTGYVGYIDTNALGPANNPTHRVHTRMTLVFDAPDFKRPDPVALPCGALVEIARVEGKYAQTVEGRFALAAHLSPVRTHQPDLCDTAAKLIGTPYLWGGNSAFGIDCSGLVQLACQAAGIPCPGDSDQQRAALGEDLPPDTAPVRNDLMFWRGHVALLEDANTLLHANAYHMAVAREPLDLALARIDAQGDGPLLAHKRL